ncbi:hypothetical protein PHJA_002517900 [Phtheirospermum japonicum]|uniref:Uncharacterized protein n=1 Tax=Phtheirospermum japonicum TaxID=374723 RepID=A0A830CV24_9LAMI|nr:hypothetical protein PHJA_002517900 [Phtheirospermum japonicum]
MAETKQKTGKRRHRSPDPENPSQQPPADSPRNDGVSAAAEEEENGDGRPWKLRRRKEAVKAASTLKQEACAEKNDKKADSNCNGIKSQRLRGMVEGGQLNGGGAERKGKRRVWISLSREEIEEDVYALTGGKPARRPKKWPKNVQKQLDNVFPGLYLAGVAADSYRAMMQWYGLGSSLFCFLNVVEVCCLCMHALELLLYISER